MAGSQVTIVANQIEKQRLGYQAMSLTHYDDNLEPQIAAGSKVEIGGALFEFTALESITGWAGISNNSDVYTKLTVSGASVTASFTTTAPTWDTAKQGWYIGGTERVIGGLRKDGSGNYINKWLYAGRSDNIRALGTGKIEYHGDFAFLASAAGDNLWLSADAEVVDPSASYIKHKEIFCPFDGTIRIAFDLHGGGGVPTVYGRIYKNGVAVGTERSTTSATYVTYTEDLVFAANDLIQLYIHCNGSAQNAYARNFRISSALAILPLLKAILQGSLIILD